ncbi:MAG: hypothetical protein EPO22_09865 [Dehalococcoidia bacterium]|nr:MAG: hypothetical protein EPO22_09865 [Dehalococcoidia bacterium]
MNDVRAGHGANVLGSRQFQVVGRGTNAERAFWTEVAKALEIHGDDGYTGTIAEKYKFVLFERPVDAPVSKIVRWALEIPFADRDFMASDIPPSVRQLVYQVADLTSDKWGPAVAMQLTPEETGDQRGDSSEQVYLFFGSAPY